ncbi:uncharacterized protein LOC126680458 isoform X2 [Mercurialis annua]|uniref:uncharacterized protein LOC126680458 isoform X2 n=1 Tax=Mercurialis annua TaxID=3986 RepID=UPI00215F44CA|nr:uncharacterized protein LOC126680458 isoform X2 [Mercurialis annua]
MVFAMRSSQPRAQVTIRFSTYLRWGYYVRDRPLYFRLPVPELLERTSILTPVGYSDETLELAKTLQTRTMTDIGIPEADRNEIIEKLALECRTEYAGNGRLTITRDREEDDNEDEEDDSDDEELPFISLSSAAAKSSIDALDRINVSAGDGMECSVCLEGIEVSEPAIRMPCLHCYHQDCIVKWLCQNHSCPLCRYELPAEL